MSRYIDIDDGRNCYIGNDGEYERYNIDPDVLDEAVEIIRCMDCKHYQFANNRAFGMPVKMCEWFGFEDVDDYDFCSRAERKEKR